jgi:hypothetical protein
MMMLTLRVEMRWHYLSEFILIILFLLHIFNQIKHLLELLRRLLDVSRQNGQQVFIFTKL